MSNDTTQVKQEADRRKVLKAINAQVLASHRLNSDPGNFVINQNSLADAFADLLATVRREAFKDAQVMMDAAVAGTMASTEFHKGFEAMRRLAKRVLERAAASVL